MAGKRNGVILKKEHVSNDLEVKRASDVVIGLKLEFESVMFSVVSCYDPREEE